jgi:hypothetical protein
LFSAGVLCQSAGPFHFASGAWQETALGEHVNGARLQQPLWPKAGRVTAVAGMEGNLHQTHVHRERRYAFGHLLRRAAVLSPRTQRQKARFSIPSALARTTA